MKDVRSGDMDSLASMYLRTLMGLLFSANVGAGGKVGTGSLLTCTVQLVELTSSALDTVGDLEDLFLED